MSVTLAKGFAASGVHCGIKAGEGLDLALVATADGVERFEEPHELGLFTHPEYLEAFRAAGLEGEHDAEGLMGRGLYVGWAPAAGTR